MAIRGTLLGSALRHSKQYLYIAGIILAGVVLSLVNNQAHAQNGPANLNISGVLYNANGTTVSSSNVSFKLELWDATATCMLYSEIHNTQDLSNTKGGFSLVIGTGSSPNNYLDNNTAFSASLFKNPGTTVSVTGCGSSINLTSGSERLIRVSYDLAGGSAYVAMNPDVPVVSAPYAMVAESLQGKSSTDFILTNVNTMLKQASMEYLFTNTNYTNLKALVDGSSSQYIVSNPSSPVSFGSQRLTNVANPTGAQDAATKNYADGNIGGKVVNMSGLSVGSGGGRTLMWDASTGEWTTSALGSVGYIAAGTGLTGGPITSSGTLSVDVGTNANQILQLDSSAQIPAVNGSLLTNVNAMMLQSRTLSAVAPADGQVFTWNNSASEWQPMTPAGGTITGLNGDVTASGSGVVAATIANNAITSAKINSTGVAVNRLLITDGSTGNSVTYMTCNLGEVLQWSGSGWGCVSMSVALGTTSVTAGTYGSGAFVPRLTVDPQGRVTSLTNVNIDFPVTSVAGRTGAVTLNASDIGSLGTAATKDVGVAANQIVQLDGSANLPAVNGSALTNVNAVKLQSRDVAATAPAGGQVLGWNADGSQWEPMSAATGSVVSVMAGAGLNGGNITSSGTLSVDVGTGANQIVQLNASSQLPAVDGSQLANVNANATKIGTRAVSSSAPSQAQYIGWNSSGSQWEPMTGASGTVTQITSGAGLVAGTITGSGTLNVDVGTGANQIVQLNASSQLPAVDGSLLTAVKIGTRSVATSAPAQDQYLGWNANGSQWEPMTATTGTVTQITSGTGLVAGSITGNGTLNVDVGTGANQIVQLTAGSQIPAVDGNLVTNINAVKLQSRNVAATPPGGGQVLGWNANGSQWEPMSAAVGSVISVQAGAGLNGGNITSSGTLSVDVGTGANQIVQLNASSQLPAVDGSQLTNVNANATKIGTRAVSSSAPSQAQYIGWNSSGSQWEPMTGASGTVTQITSGAGLVAGTITGSGTLNVDVGTGANQIVQLNASSQLPAIDGSLLTGVKIGTRTVATSAPNQDQYLGWNANGSQWEPMTGSTGTVTQITSGTGLVAGSITGSGTLNVDVGTTANKVLQLTAGAQIPAVDGNLVTNVNAVKLQSRDISATAPSGGQVLSWNANGSQWEPMSAAVGSVISVQAGAGLNGGNITSSGTLSVDVGTGANQIVQLTGGGKLPAVDGSLLTNVNPTFPLLASPIGTAGAPTYSFNGDANTGVFSPGADNLSFATNGAERLRIDANGGVGVGSTSAIFMDGTNGRIGLGTINPQFPVDIRTTSDRALFIDHTGTWASTVRVISNVQAGASAMYFSAQGANSSGIMVDTGQASVTLLDLYGLPGHTADLVRVGTTSPGDVFKITGDGKVGIGTMTPTNTLTVGGDGTMKLIGASNWAFGPGQIRHAGGHLFIEGGNNGIDLTDGGGNTLMYLNNNGNIGVGTVTPNALLDVAGTMRVTTICDSAGLNCKTVSSGWGAGGSVTNVSAGTGLTGGNISTTGTLNVDVGTGANQILQLDASAKIPAVDGSLVTNVNANATKIGTRTVSSAAPAQAQYIGWNSNGSQWEPMTPSTGTVTQISSGTGLVAGTITGNGTLM